MRGMFQPQPTPFAPSYFASSSFAFPTAAPTSNTTTSTTTGTTNTNISASPSAVSDPSSISYSAFAPSPPSLSPYGLAPPAVPFGFYFPPAPLGGGAGTGAGGAGPALGRAPTPTTDTATASRPRAGATAATTSPNSSARGLVCRSSQPASSQFASSANLPRHQQQQKPSSPQHQLHHPRSPVPTMEDQQDPHGMAAQQAAAKDYQPDLPVCLSAHKAYPPLCQTAMLSADDDACRTTWLATRRQAAPLPKNTPRPTRPTSRRRLFVTHCHPASQTRAGWCRS